MFLKEVLNLDDKSAQNEAEKIKSVIDDNTLNNNTVTIRDRDTMQQITMNIDEIPYYVIEKTLF